MRASNEGASLAKGISEKCSKKTNPVALLDHIDTPSAAKDLDILRQLSGDSKLNYLGYSTAPTWCHLRGSVPQQCGPHGA